MCSANVIRIFKYFENHLRIIFRSFIFSWLPLKMQYKGLGVWPPNFWTGRLLELETISLSGFYLGFGLVWFGFFPCNLSSCLFLKWKFQVLFGSTGIQKHYCIWEKSTSFRSPYKWHIWSGKLSSMATMDI